MADLRNLVWTPTLTGAHARYEVEHVQYPYTLKLIIARRGDAFQIELSSDASGQVYDDRKCGSFLHATHAAERMVHRWIAAGEVLL